MSGKVAREAWRMRRVNQRFRRGEIFISLLYRNKKIKYKSVHASPTRFFMFRCTAGNIVVIRFQKSVTPPRQVAYAPWPKTIMTRRHESAPYDKCCLGVKTRKILQQNFDQDAVGDLVWCGNMNWKNIAVYIPHRLTRQGNWTLKFASYFIPCLRSGYEAQNLK